jgi:hypothetical protein
MLAEIELAADEIDAGATDSRVHSNTLLWRLSSVPATVEAALRPDPGIAFLDLYALRLQLERFFRSEAGKENFGGNVAPGLAAMARFSVRWEAEVSAMGGVFRDEGRATVQSWADAHPIDRLPFTRPSLVGALANEIREQHTSIGTAVGGMQESLDRLEDRVSLFDDYGVKQGLWVSQLAAIETRSSPEASALLDTLGQIGTLAGQTPALMGRERAALLAEVNREREQTLQTVIHERTLVVQELVNQRELILRGVDQQRRETLEDLETLRAKTTQDAMRVVDHFMLRLTELTAAALTLFIVAAFVIRRWA